MGGLSASDAHPAGPAAAGPPGGEPAPGQGEPALGHRVSATAIQSVVRRHGVPPAPRRAGLVWPDFLRVHAPSLLAGAFVAVETARPQVIYARFFIHVYTRRVFLAGCTGTRRPPG